MTRFDYSIWPKNAQRASLDSSDDDSDFASKGYYHGPKPPSNTNKFESNHNFDSSDLSFSQNDFHGFSRENTPPLGPTLSPRSDESIEYVRSKPYTPYEHPNNERGDLDANILEYNPNFSQRNSDSNRAGLYQNNNNIANADSNTNNAYSVNNYTARPGYLSSQPSSPQKVSASYPDIGTNKYNWNNQNEPVGYPNTRQLNASIANLYKEQQGRDYLQKSRSKPEMPLSADPFNRNNQGNYKNRSLNDRKYGGVNQYRNDNDNDGTWNGKIPKVYRDEDSFFDELNIDPRKTRYFQFKEERRRIHESSMKKAEEIMRNEQARRERNQQTTQPRQDVYNNNRNNNPYLKDQDRPKFNGTTGNFERPTARAYQPPSRSAVSKTPSKPSLSDFAPSSDTFEPTITGPVGNAYIPRYKTHPRVAAYNKRYPNIASVPMDESDELVLSALNNLTHKMQNLDNIKANEVGLLQTLRYYETLTDAAAINSELHAIENKFEGLHSQLVNWYKDVKNGHGKLQVDNVKTDEIPRELRDAIDLLEIERDFLRKQAKIYGVSVTKKTAIKQGQVNHQDYDSKVVGKAKQQILDITKSWNDRSLILDDNENNVHDFTKLSKSSQRGPENPQVLVESTTDEEFQNLKAVPSSYGRQKKLTSKKKLVSSDSEIDEEAEAAIPDPIKSRSSNGNPNKSLSKKKLVHVYSTTDGKPRSSKGTSKKLHSKKKLIHLTSETDEDADEVTFTPVVSRSSKGSSKKSHAKKKLIHSTPETDDDSEGVSISYGKSNNSSKSSSKKKPALLKPTTDEDSESLPENPSQANRSNLRKKTVDLDNSIHTDEESLSDDDVIDYSRQKHTSSKNRDSSNHSQRTIADGSSTSPVSLDVSQESKTVDRDSSPVLSTKITEDLKKLAVTPGEANGDLIDLQTKMDENTNNAELLIRVNLQLNRPKGEDISSSSINSLKLKSDVTDIKSQIKNESLPLADVRSVSQDNLFHKCYYCPKETDIDLAPNSVDFNKHTGFKEEPRSYTAESLIDHSNLQSGHHGGGPTRAGQSPKIGTAFNRVSISARTLRCYMRQMAEQYVLTMRDAKILLSELKSCTDSYDDMAGILENTDDFATLPEAMQRRLQRGVAEVLQRLTTDGDVSYDCSESGLNKRRGSLFSDNYNSHDDDSDSMYTGKYNLL
ncbi:hypothetical protein NADFUDRAFT_79512 [Nadsonia fulvescens var. elongata DSM 6958]|uniref:Uncharacterized protein n=1 Tax=Nadsonia fulvescens var. elongata DSM 6958 TaxID=857566 RepID=A0A1E3PGT7_9ASCO|nr:hypothetical protein NADFUDRAFT_79512 [Nadsonia fulvescens var. elongata DSM 6958]